MFQLQVIIGNASLKWAVPRFGESVVFERDGPSWRKIPDADGTGQAQFITQDGIAVVVLCFKGLTLVEGLSPFILGQLLDVKKRYGRAIDALFMCLGADDIRNDMSQLLGDDHCRALGRKLHRALFRLRDKVFEHFGSKLKVWFLGIGAMPLNVQDAFDVNTTQTIVEERLRQREEFCERLDLTCRDWCLNGFDYSFFEIFEGVHGSASGEVHVSQMQRCAQSLSSIVGVFQ